MKKLSKVMMMVLSLGFFGVALAEGQEVTGPDIEVQGHPPKQENRPNLNDGLGGGDVVRIPIPGGSVRVLRLPNGGAGITTHLPDGSIDTTIIFPDGTIETHHVPSPQEREP